VLTPFFTKTGQRDKEKKPMKIECNRPIEEREKSGQQDSPMVRVQLYQWNGESTNRPMVNQRIDQWREKRR
jgi:hypothetical protein